MPTPTPSPTWTGTGGQAVVDLAASWGPVAWVAVICVVFALGFMMFGTMR